MPSNPSNKTTTNSTSNPTTKPADNLRHDLTRDLANDLTNNPANDLTNDSTNDLTKNPTDNPSNPSINPEPPTDINGLLRIIVSQQQTMREASARLLQASAGIGSVVTTLGESHSEADAGRYSVLGLLQREIEATAASLEH